MHYPSDDNSVLLLKMESEEHYRHQAECYRSSDEYKRMIRLYPLLKSSIGECEDEKLFA